MNDTHGLSKENLLRSFQLTDERIKALAELMAEKLSQRAEEANLGVLYANIDRLPEPVLDMLAYDFKVDWWDSNYSLEEKRRTLKDSWRVHRMMGTKAAVETAISAIYPNTKVEEWFEYDGEPYGFRLLVDASHESVDPEKHRRVLERVEYYKNIRSHMDRLEYAAVPDGTGSVYAAAAMAGMEVSFTKEAMAYVE